MYMYVYTNGMPLLHVQTETTCTPFVYNTNELGKEKNQQMWEWINSEKKIFENPEY